MTDASDIQANASTTQLPSVTSLPTPPQALRYPLLLSETSFASLVTHSVASTNAVQMELAPRETPAPTSLSESWASISDVEDSHDEDLQSEVTDAGSLVDVQSTADAQIAVGLIGSDDDSDFERSEGDKGIGPPPATTKWPELQSLMQSCTLAASYPISPSGLNDEIYLYEPSCDTDSDSGLVNHTLTQFQPSGAEKFRLAPYSEKGYEGTLHIKLSRKPLEGNKCTTFRLLLLGPNHTDYLRETLVNKVADALIASSPSVLPHGPPSRYHIVPDSFGPGSHPAAAEVIPVARTLDVESFHTGTLNGSKGETSVLYNEETMSALTSTWSEREGRYVVTTPGWQQPNLTVILVDDKSSAEARNSASAMMIFVKRLSIPALVIRTSNSWNPDFADLICTELGAKLCIQNKSGPEAGNVWELPISLDVFLRINSSQLGRHIAYLVNCADDAASPHPKLADQEIVVPSSAHVTGARLEMARKVTTEYLKRTKPLHILHAVGAMAGFLILLQWIAILRTSSNSHHAHLTPIKLHDKVIHHPNVGDSIFIATSTVPLITSSVAEPVNPTQIFEAEALGQSHIIVRTVQTSASQTWKIDLYRGSRKVEFEYNVLFPGVFSIHFDPLQAYGELKVCLTKVKSVEKECAIVAFRQHGFAAWLREVIDDGEDRLHIQLTALRKLIQDACNSGLPQITFKAAQKRILELENAAKKDLRSKWDTTSVHRHEALISVQAFFRAAQNSMPGLAKTAYQNAKATSRNLLERLRASFDYIEIYQPTNRLVPWMRERMPTKTLTVSQHRARRIVTLLKGRFWRE